MEQPAPARQLDTMDAALEDDEELQEQGEEDVPANPGRDECHAIWASLLDVQDEDQVREGLERASSSSSRPDMQLAPRHVERVTRIIHGMTTEGIIRMSINLPHLLHGIQAAIGDIIQDALDIRKRRQIAATDPQREDEDIAFEDQEEEVPVEDEEQRRSREREDTEENAFMQHPKHTEEQKDKKRKPNEAAPLHAEERARLVQLVRDTLTEQNNAEPALTLLALLGEEPDCLRHSNCSAGEEDSGGEMLTTLPELRPAIRRWYSASPQKFRPRMAATLLRLRGGKLVQDKEAVQRIARAMQNEVGPGASPLMQALLENWNEDTDAGILEQILGSLSNRGESKAAQKALHQIREMRQAPQNERADVGQQALMQAWDRAVRDPSHSTSSKDIDDPDTAHVRQQLLGLQEGWPDFGEQGRWAIMELLVSSLSEAVLQRNAQHVAAVYAGVAEDTPPPALLELRIHLRKRSMEEPQDGEQGQARNSRVARKQRLEEEKQSAHDNGKQTSEGKQQVGESQEERRPKQQSEEAVKNKEGQTTRERDTEETEADTEGEEERCRRQYEEMQREEEVMHIAMYEAYEEQMAIEAEEAWERDHPNYNADYRAATALDEEDSGES